MKNNGELRWAFTESRLLMCFDLRLTMFDQTDTENNKKGFYVTSYQTNIASHHSHDLHVGFLSQQASMGKYNKMSKNFFA